MIQATDVTKCFGAIHRHRPCQRPDPRRQCTRPDRLQRRRQIHFFAAGGRRQAG